MKKIIIAVSITIFLTSCKEKRVLPNSVNSVEEAKSLLTGKTWQVIDAATIRGSNLAFNSETEKQNSTIEVPKENELSWLSNIVAKKADNEFFAKFYKESFDNFRKISLNFNADSIALTTGLESNKQTYRINNNSAQNEPKGIKLTLTSESKSYESMGVSKVTSAYYILGANKNKLLILTPNELNNLKVVFLLEAK